MCWWTLLCCCVQVKDLNLYTNVVRPQSLPVPPSLTLMADTAEAAELVLQGEPIEAMKTWADLLILLHISDKAQPALGVESPNTKVLHLKMYLTGGGGGKGGKSGGGEGEGVRELVKVACGLVDRVAGVQLSGPAYEKALGLRKKADELEAKEKAKEREKEKEKEKEAKPLSKKKEDKLAAKAKKPRVKLMKH